jgi:hypothetical protein
MGHFVVVDSVEGGFVNIRDPWTATRYRLSADDFNSIWNGDAIFSF